MERDFAYTAGRDGSIIEGAVAAFFYDLVDNSSFPDGTDNATDGDDDGLSLGGNYVAAIIKTCAMQYSIGLRARGVDELTYCMENRIDPAIVNSPVYFPTGSPPSGYFESASEPAGWSPAAIRALWLKDLYGQ
jgi:hypothetical protein